MLERRAPPRAYEGAPTRRLSEAPQEQAEGVARLGGRVALPAARDTRPGRDRGKDSGVPDFGAAPGVKTQATAFTRKVRQAANGCPALMLRLSGGVKALDQEPAVA